MSVLLLVDFSHLFARCFYADYDPLASDPMDRPGLRTAMLASLSSMRPRFGASHVVMALDSKPYWRQELFPGYKEGRAKRFDSDVLSLLMKETVDDLSAIAPHFLWIKVPGAEGDDVVAVLARVKGWDEIVVHGSDGDFAQLDSLPNVRRWNPTKKQFTDRLGDPVRELLVKIACGDAGDGIPGVKKGVGPKKVLKMMNEGTFEDWLDSDPGFRPRFELNQRLIDFGKIPSDLRREIQSSFVKALGSASGGCDMPALSRYMRRTEMDGPMASVLAARLDGIPA